jgi:hypothetical protein
MATIRRNITIPPALLEAAMEKADLMPVSAIIRRLLTLWLEGKVDLSAVKKAEIGTVTGGPVRPLKITLGQDSRGWVADLSELPGTPPVGNGNTRIEAIGSLFIRLSADQHYQDLVRVVVLTQEAEK